jgi:hypothetical protein
MDKEFEAKLEEAIAAVTKLYREKLLPPEGYFKSMLCLAYEYSVQGENLRAASIAQGVPREYYQKVQRQQMVEDGNYAYVAYTLALNLLQAGFVHLGPATAATMPAASA